jgi:hypothetical protein
MLRLTLLSLCKYQSIIRVLRERRLRTLLTRVNFSLETTIPTDRRGRRRMGRLQHVTDCTANSPHHAAASMGC